MKILQVNSVYKKGSTGKITYDIHSELLNNNIESIVCYGRGEQVNEDFVYKFCGEFYSHVNHFLANLTGIMYGGCYISTKKLEKIIIKEKPDIVHLQCINGYFVNIYKLIDWLKQKKIKTVLTLHAEFMYTANCAYAFNCDKWKRECKDCTNYKSVTSSYFFDRTSNSWNKMKHAFDGFDNNLIVASVSPWLMDRAKQSAILMNKQHEVVLNGLNTEVFKLYDVSSLRQKYSVKGEKIIFHVTPYLSSDKNHIKGGYYLIELAKKLERENIKILVAGEYENDIQVPDNMVLLGKIESQKELAQLYNVADVTVLTSKIETFSMVTAESLCCGTPIVGFQSGAPEQIALKQYSYFVDYANLDQLKTSVLEFLHADFNYIELSEMANKKYSKKTMCDNYIKIYKRLSGEQV